MPYSNQASRAEPFPGEPGQDISLVRIANFPQEVQFAPL
jgi:hypothetical protein